MKLLFVHGAEKMKEDKKGNYYTDGSYTQEVWERYISVFGSLSVIFRKDSIIYDSDFARENLQHFNKRRANFIEIPDLSRSYSSAINLKLRKKNNNIIKTAVKQHDYLIVRLPSSAGIKAIKYAIRYKKPYLIEVVGCPKDALWNHSFKGKILAFFKYFSMKRVMINAPYSIYVTDVFLQQRYKSKGRFTGCSDVAIPTLENHTLEKRLLKINKKSIEEPLIIGTIAPVNVKYKGQKYVIKAVSKLNKQGYNFEYHLLGSGDDKYLKSLARKYNVEDKVKFLGSLPHNKVFEFLDNIDIYSQPSKTEGLPRALIEAMSRGCPSIGSAAGGIPELISSENLFNVGEVNEIVYLLKGMDKEKMRKEAIKNYSKSKEYDKHFLNKKRLNFLLEFSRMK